MDDKNIAARSHVRRARATRHRNQTGRCPRVRASRSIIFPFWRCSEQTAGWRAFCSRPNQNFIRSSNCESPCAAAIADDLPKNAVPIGHRPSAESVLIFNIHRRPPQIFDILAPAYECIRDVTRKWSSTHMMGEWNIPQKLAIPLQSHIPRSRKSGP
jgi:hypothetical protein